MNSISQKKFKLISKNITALILAGFLSTVFSDFSYGIHQNGYPVIQTVVSVNSIYKTVETYKGRNNLKIYLIQNLHCHAEIQVKIKEIIKSLKEKHREKLKAVGVEGSFGRIDTRILSGIKNEDIKNKTVKYFLERGYLNGAELYDIENPGNIELYGLEDKELYLEDFKRLYKSLEYREEINPVINRIKKVIERGINLMYIPELKELEQKKKEYEQGKISLNKYIKLIKTKLSKDKMSSNIENYLQSVEIKNKINKTEAYLEAQYVIRGLEKNLTKENKEILKRTKNNAEEYYSILKNIVKTINLDLGMNYKNLMQYFKYLEYKEKIDETKLIQEIDELEYRIKEEISKGLKDISQVVKGGRYLEIYEGLIRNEIDTNRLEEWHKKREDAYKTLEQITGKLSFRNYFKENKERIEQAEANMTEFYHKADKRNEVMVKNMLNKLLITNYKLQMKEKENKLEKINDKKQMTPIVIPSPRLLEGKLSRGISSEVNMRCLDGVYTERSRSVRHDNASCYSCEGRNPDFLNRPFVIPSGSPSSPDCSRGISKQMTNNEGHVSDISSLISNSSLVISNYNYSFGIIIAGGYHSKGIKEILRSKGISYEVIIPKIKESYNKNIYLERVKEQAGWLNKEYYSVKQKKEETKKTQYIDKTLEKRIGLSDKLELISILGTNEGIKKINEKIKKIEET
ncbi:hypothetical protein ACFL4O_02490, partial [bacterium]